MKTLRRYVWDGFNCSSFLFSLQDPACLIAIFIYIFFWSTTFFNGHEKWAFRSLLPRFTAYGRHIWWEHNQFWTGALFNIILFNKFLFAMIISLRIRGVPCFGSSDIGDPKGKWYAEVERLVQSIREGGTSRRKLISNNEKGTKRPKLNQRRIRNKPDRPWCTTRTIRHNPIIDLTFYFILLLLLPGFELIYFLFFFHFSRACFSATLLTSNDLYEYDITDSSLSPRCPSSHLAWSSITVSTHIFCLWRGNVVGSDFVLLTPMFLWVFILILAHVSVYVIMSMLSLFASSSTIFSLLP